MSTSAKMLVGFCTALLLFAVPGLVDAEGPIAEQDRGGLLLGTDADGSLSGLGDLLGVSVSNEEASSMPEEERGEGRLGLLDSVGTVDDAVEDVLSADGVPAQEVVEQTDRVDPNGVEEVLEPAASEVTHSAEGVPEPVTSQVADTLEEGVGVVAGGSPRASGSTGIVDFAVQASSDLLDPVLDPSHRVIESASNVAAPVLALTDRVVEHAEAEVSDALSPLDEIAGPVLETVVDEVLAPAVAPLVQSLDDAIEGTTPALAEIGERGELEPARVASLLLQASAVPAGLPPPSSTPATLGPTIPNSASPDRFPAASSVSDTPPGRSFSPTRGPMSRGLVEHEPAAHNSAVGGAPVADAPMRLVPIPDAPTVPGPTRSNGRPVGSQAAVSAGARAPPVAPHGGGGLSVSDAHVQTERHGNDSTTSFAGAVHEPLRPREWRGVPALRPG